MNIYALRAIYLFEMSRTWRTLLQSIVSPVISTSLYFVVFGAAIGSRMQAVNGVSYGAFIIPQTLLPRFPTKGHITLSEFELAAQKSLSERHLPIPLGFEYRVQHLEDLHSSSDSSSRGGRCWI